MSGSSPRVLRRDPFDRDVIDRWLEFDSELETSAPTTEEEIISEVTEKFQKGDQSDDEDEANDGNDSFEVAPAPFMDTVTRIVIRSFTFLNPLRLSSL